MVTEIVADVAAILQAPRGLSMMVAKNPAPRAVRLATLDAATSGLRPPCGQASSCSRSARPRRRAEAGTANAAMGRCA